MAQSLGVDKTGVASSVTAHRILIGRYLPA